MKSNFTDALVSYKGKEVDGLILPLSIQRINQKIQIPEGYTCIGKQQFGNGLRICFIPSVLIVKSQPIPLKEGEYTINNYKTNFQIQDIINKVTNIVKECYLKDSSEQHYKWLKNAIHNRMGLNSIPNIADEILQKNWNYNKPVFLKYSDFID